MSTKSFRKRFRNAGARVAMAVGLLLVRISPYFVFRGTMHFFSFLWFRGAKHLRKVARESLTIAFGGTKDRREINGIVRQCFKNVSRSMMDLVYHCYHPQEVRGRFIVEHREYLDQALAKGKGVILVTAHFGNFPLMLLELAQLGYKPAVILKRARDPWMADKIYSIMSRVGVQTIYYLPPRESVRQSLSVLRENNILCVLLDQNFGNGTGVFVDFFGEKAATATGPVVMAERTGATIVMVFTILEGDKYRILLEPPIELEERPDHDEKILVNVQRITSIIEGYIRRYPAEWGWMHRRWKTKQVEAT